MEDDNNIDLWDAAVIMLLSLLIIIIYGIKKALES